MWPPSYDVIPLGALAVNLRRRLTQEGRAVAMQGTEEPVMGRETLLAKGMAAVLTRACRLPLPGAQRQVRELARAAEGSGGEEERQAALRVGLALWPLPLLGE